MPFITKYINSTKGIDKCYIFESQTKTNTMKNYQIEFILKSQIGNSFKLEQQIISVEASNKKDALKLATKKLYIPRNFIKIDYKQFITN